MRAAVKTMPRIRFPYPGYLLRELPVVHPLLKQLYILGQPSAIARHVALIESEIDFVSVGKHIFVPRRSNFRRIELISIGLNNG